jgi:squalene-associated FAD-dependent desaturase
MTGMRGRIIIIGGGLAGMSAAATLAGQPVSVRLLESRRTLGGRAGSYLDPVSNQEIDYCQHVGMGCCGHLIDFLQKTGQSDRWQRAGHLTFIDGRGRRFGLSADRLLPAPLHLARSMARQFYLPFSARWAIAKALLRMARDPNGPADERFYGWLQASGQPPVAIDRFWNVILTSALGEDVRRVAYRPARKVLVDGFMRHASAYEVLIPQQPLAQLFGDHTSAWLTRNSVEVVSAASVRELVVDGQRATHCGLHDGRRMDADQFIVAVPWHQLARTLGAATRQIAPSADLYREIPSAPISGVHLWFDRAVTDLPHAVFVDRLSQWMFQRPVGPSRTDPVAAGSSHYLQIVISASRGLAGRDREDVLAEIVGDLRSAFPAARDAQLLRAKIVTDPSAVFSVTPAVERLRPASETPLTNVHLAGDWTRTGWPATMEGALISGRTAAARALAALQLAAPASLTTELTDGWLARMLIRNRREPDA